MGTVATCSSFTICEQTKHISLQNAKRLWHNAAQQHNTANFCIALDESLASNTATCGCGRPMLYTVLTRNPIVSLPVRILHDALAPDRLEGGARQGRGIQHQPDPLRFESLTRIRVEQILEPETLNPKLTSFARPCSLTALKALERGCGVCTVHAAGCTMNRRPSRCRCRSCSA